MQNVAKEGTLHQSREASEVYLTIQKVRILGKTEVSRSQLIKCIQEKDSAVRVFKFMIMVNASIIAIFDLSYINSEV